MMGGGTCEARVEDVRQLGLVLDGGHPDGGETVGQCGGQLALAVVAARIHGRHQAEARCRHNFLCACAALLRKCERAAGLQHTAASIVLVSMSLGT